MLCYSLSCYIMSLLYSEGVDKNMKKTRTAVNICGKEYVMAGFESEEYIHRVAICVDRKMADLKEQYVNLNPNTLSVLTAINVADDLLKLHDEFDALRLENEALIEEIKKLKIEMSLENDGNAPITPSSNSQITANRFDEYK